MPFRNATLIMLGTILALASPGRASPLKSPRRSVNGQGVNLTPLFSWWTNRHGARPLTAWVHVSGTIVGTNGFNWVIHATIEQTSFKSDGEEGKRSATDGEGRILLRTPPTSDRAQFEQLLAQSKDLKAQRAKVASIEAQAKSQEKQAVSYRGRSRTVSNAQARETDQEAQGALKELDQQIKDVETKLGTFPSKDHYSVDCFALVTGKHEKGLPVYDHGASWQ